jgi:hypothetical protein
VKCANGLSGRGQKLCERRKPSPILWHWKGMGLELMVTTDAAAAAAIAVSVRDARVGLYPAAAVLAKIEAERWLQR